MKHLLLLLILLMLSGNVSARQHTFSVVVSNSMKCNRTDEPVVVRLSDVKGLRFAVCSATVTVGGHDIPCQLDDLDGDMIYDELAWLADIDASATCEYQVTLSDIESNTTYPSRVWAALMMRDKKDLHPQLTNVEADGASNLFNDIFMHGAVMESELVGWRIYFDKRQNLDLYGKKQRRLEIAETEFYTTAEQLQQGYGVDVLWAGGAIGCGTFRGWDNDSPTLIEDVKTRGQRIVAKGPVRTIIEVKDYGWKVRPNDEHRVNVMQRYTMYAGHRDVEVSVQVIGNETFFCTGVQKVGVTASDSVRCGHKSEGFIHDGIAASWGCDYPDMGKKQIWPPQAIGLATCVPAKAVTSTSESDLNYLLVFPLGNNKKELTYHTAFCVDKEADGFHTAQAWFAWVQQWKERLSHPLKARY